jgi:hypothetical protein
VNRNPQRLNEGAVTKRHLSGNGNNTAGPSGTSRNASVAEQRSHAFAVPPELIDAIAERAAEILAERFVDDRVEDRWMGTRDAAAYLGLTTNALHKLTAARQVPFAQDTAGGKSSSSAREAAR